ncbi:MAG: DUF6789 family protein [Mycobacteriales bacterium]
MARGAAAGLVGTAAMSALMLAAGRVGLLGQQPPQAIAEHAMRRGGGADPPAPADRVLGIVAHLGFGLSAGGAYALLPRRLPPQVRGCAWGLGIYAASYQGWVPALGTLPKASADRRDRVAVIVLAHVVYGSVLARMEEALSRRAGEVAQRRRM